MSDVEIPPRRDFPRGRLQLRAGHLVREMARSRRRRRLVLTLAPAIVILLTAATGFTAYVLQRTEPTHFESIGCYARADLSADVSIISADGRGAVVQCREVWDRDGSLIPQRLAACVLPTGPIGVFPSIDSRTCERLGLADVSVQAETESGRFVRMRDAIYARIGTPPSGSSRGSSRCVGEERARAIVRSVLNAHGYSEWKVATAGEPFSRTHPCTEVAFDDRSKTVLLIADSRN